MVRVVVLALVASLLLGTPAWGQSAEEIEKLIAQLGDEDDDVRANAASALGQIGPQAAPAVPALIEAVVSQTGMSSQAIEALGRIGPAAAAAVPALVARLGLSLEVPLALGRIGAPAVPALVAALADPNSYVRAGAAYALKVMGPAAAPAIPALIERFDGLGGANPGGTWTPLPGDSHGKVVLESIGTDLKAQGTVLWWVVPRVYWKPLVALLLLLAAWFALAGRFPRHRPASSLKHLALMTLTATVPMALACSTIGSMVTRRWAQGFLPDAVTLVPFPVAAVLSTALVCVLPAVWVCQRKKVAGAETPSA